MDSDPHRQPAESDQHPGFKPRRAERRDVDHKVSLRPQSLYNVEVKVRNVSTCGFMAECDERVRIGSYVSLDVPGIGPVYAQVRWQIGARMGGMFLDPISLSRCEWSGVKADQPPETEPA